MIRKLLICALALSCALPIASLALEAPASGAAPFGSSGFGNMQNAMPPAMQRPQADEATVRLVWQAVLGRFPEMVEGPERDGYFVVSMALWPDGRFVAGGMRYVDKPNQTNAVQNELRDQLPMDINGVSGMPPVVTKGSAVLGDRVLKANVMLNVSMVPSNWDASRDKGIIRRAVMQPYADLFLSRDADHVNQLVVVMNEKGEIAQKKVVEIAVEHRGSMTTYKSSNLQATDFAALGLDAEHVGVMGDLRLNMPPTMRPPTPDPALGADGIARGQMPSFDSPMLIVRYAWPRRAGEPVGGTPLAWNSIPRQERPQEPMLQISQLAGKYFPAGSASQGNWMVVTFNGEVLRTGHVDLAKNESLANVYAERLMPGIKVASSMGMTHLPAGSKPGDPAGTPINITIFFLAADSPLPPPEEIRPVRAE